MEFEMIKEKKEFKVIKEKKKRDLFIYIFY